MVKRDAIVSFLNSYLKVEKFLEDPYFNGLIVEGKEEVESVLLTPNVTRKVINYASENFFDFVISHHGLFSKKTGSYVKGWIKDVIKKALSSNMFTVLLSLIIRYL